MNNRERKEEDKRGKLVCGNNCREKKRGNPRLEYTYIRDATYCWL